MSKKKDSFCLDTHSLVSGFCALKKNKKEKDMVEFKVIEKEKLTIVKFELTTGVVSPEELKKFKTPQVNLTKGVIISGRGPIWLHSFLAHEYHPAVWVGHLDPRLNGAVVVQSHVKDVSEGDIIQLG